MNDDADPGPPPLAEAAPALPPVIFPGDLVQVTNTQLPTFRLIGIVTHVRGWGVQANYLIPDPKGGPAQDHGMRLRHGDFGVAGAALVMTERMLADRRAAMAAEAGA